MQEPMSLTRPELDVAKLREALAPKLLQLHEVKVNGARLAPLVDSALPEGAKYRDYLPLTETPRLRTFVETYLSELVQCTDERSGADVVYRIVHAVEDDAGLSRSDGQLWKTFVALSPSKRLVYDRATSELGLLDTLAEGSESVCPVQSVTFDEHRQLCEDFYGALLESGRGSHPLLRAILDEFQFETYPMWLRTLRMARPPLDKEWGRYRQQGVLRIFRKRLETVGVPSQRIVQLELQLSRDHEQAIRAKLGKAAQEAKVADAGPEQVPVRSNKEERARELLHAVVNRMSYEQMQNISLPFGVVLDVMSHSLQQ